MRNSNEFCDNHGMPSRPFFEQVARSIGGVPGFRTMTQQALSVAIVLRLRGSRDESCLGSSDLSKWFEFVQAATAGFFAQGQYSDKRLCLAPIDDLGGAEGRRLMALHQRIERNSRIVKFLKENSSDKDYLGFVICRICRVAPGARFGVEVIEAHHVLPLALAGVKKPKLSDFILVCPTCHSAIHKGAKIDMPTA